ncbi:MAG TPA: META domain-containing protein [Candidatus Woesebacteria bacterium]|nr:META domain-containing protein [Candidatus Woesebacteria bacterium]
MATNKSKSQTRLFIGIFVILLVAVGLYIFTRNQKTTTIEQPTQSQFSGIFKANLPAASTSGRTIILNTQEDGTAVFTQDYQNEEPPIVETGSWTEANNSLQVTLTHRGEELLDPPITMTFAYHIMNGGSLELIGDIETWGSEGLILQNLKPLLSTKWIWTETVMSDDTRTEPNADRSFSLTFDEDGRMTATTDCNNGMGMYEIRGINNLVFGPIASTLMYCEGSQETAFFGQLAEVDSYLLEDGKLHLLLKMDSGTMSFDSQQL